MKNGKDGRSFAAELAAAREQMKATEWQMAKRLDITIDTYRAIIAGKNLPAPAIKALRRRLEKAVEQWKL